MRATCILFLRDPLIALDLAEIITETVANIDVYVPTTAAEAVEHMEGASCLVLDRFANQSLNKLAPNHTIPSIYVGMTPTAAPADHEVYLDEPFTNKSVHAALSSLGLETTTWRR